MPDALLYENFWKQSPNLELRLEGGKVLQRSPASGGDLGATYKSASGLLQVPLPPTQSGRPSVSTGTAAAQSADPLKVALFAARAQAKQIAAQLSMHLPEQWRLRIFNRIDELLDAAEWEEGDGMLSATSMRTFLRFVIYAGVGAVPSLGMTATGNLMAAWRRAGRRLSIEFQVRDQCRLALSDLEGDEPSIITFTGVVAKAWEFLERESFSLG